MKAKLNEIAAIVIGRNEGDRLRVCLESIRDEVTRVVYVDSGSSDGSVPLAHSLGVEVVELDMAIPFTAARGRNAGIDHLENIGSVPSFIQFVDGDCEIMAGWFSAAMSEIQKRDDIAVVCGRRHERHPDRSLYNRIVDMEWNTPVGEATSCGGDALIRYSALKDVHGYDASLIAGEEPEMCLRMRSKGWKIMRIAQDMTLHDAQLKSFRQFWRRSVRCGHAYAEGYALHGRTPNRYRERELRSILFWSLLLPSAIFIALPTSRGRSLLFLGGYTVLWNRIRRHRLAMNDTPLDAAIYAGANIVFKFAELQGMAQYLFNRLLGKKSRIIEYKVSSKKVDATT